jgi:transcriptional regulator with XRE-family HTH domain
MSRGRVAGQAPISAQQVKALHEVLMQPGYCAANAAAAAGVSRSTASLIIQGKYPLNPDAQAEWDQTFGVCTPGWTYGPHINAAKIKDVYRLISEGSTLSDVAALTGLSLTRLEDLASGKAWFREEALFEVYRQTFGLQGNNPILKSG